MSETADIIVRLRDQLDYGPEERSLALYEEAADEIEQLRLERDKANQQVALLQHEVRL
jgi:hypothetical protein